MSQLEISQLFFCLLFDTEHVAFRADRTVVLLETMLSKWERTCADNHFMITQQSIVLNLFLYKLNKDYTDAVDWGNDQ